MVLHNEAGERRSCINGSDDCQGAFGLLASIGSRWSTVFWASACMSAGLEWEGTPSTTAMTILLLLHIVITYLKDDFGLVAQSYIYDD